MSENHPSIVKDPVWLSHIDDTFMGLYEKPSRDVRNPKQWLRVDDLQEVCEITSMDPSEAMNFSERHLDYIKSLGGVAIPKYERYISDTDLEGNNRPTLYSAVAGVDGYMLSNLYRYKRYPYTPDREAMMTDLAATLDNYRAWAEDREPFGLCDITSIAQYILGVQSGESIPRVHLVDIQPLLCRPDISEVDWRESKIEFDEWVEDFAIELGSGL